MNNKKATAAAMTVTTTPKLVKKNFLPRLIFKLTSFSRFFVPTANNPILRKKISGYEKIAARVHSSSAGKMK